MALASLPGKLDEYLDLEKSGLTALELDVKDQNGEVGFVPSSVPLAKSVGAARGYYDARDVARRAHERGLYLVGRIVVFEDPVLSRARPGPGDPTDGRVGLARCSRAGVGESVRPARVALQRRPREAAARAGFDEIMFDYVRFPSDGDVDRAVYGSRGSLGSGKPSRRSCGMRTDVSSRSVSACRLPCSASRPHAISASARSRDAWRRISTPCTR